MIKGGIYTHKRILFSLKKKETLPFTTTWIKLGEMIS